MSLADALRGLIGGGDRGPVDPAEIARDLIAQHGSRRAAARESGYPESTLRRWERGAVPRPEAMERLGATRRDLTAATIRREDIVLHTRDVADGRARRIGPDQLQLPADIGDRVRAAYVRGGADEAARALHKAIGDPFYRQWLRNDVPAGSRGGASTAAGGGGGGAPSGAVAGGYDWTGGGDDADAYDTTIYEDTSYEGDDSDGDYGTVVATVGR